MILYALSLVGVAVFAASGALAAGRKQLRLDRRRRDRRGDRDRRRHAARPAARPHPSSGSPTRPTSGSILAGAAGTLVYVQLPPAAGRAALDRRRARPRLLHDQRRPGRRAAGPAGRARGRDGGDHGHRGRRAARRALQRGAAPVRAAGHALCDGGDRGRDRVPRAPGARRRAHGRGARRHGRDRRRCASRRSSGGCACRRCESARTTPR